MANMAPENSATTSETSSIGDSSVIHVSSIDEVESAIYPRPSIDDDCGIDETSSVDSFQPAIFKRLPADKNPFLVYKFCPVQEGSVMHETPPSAQPVPPNKSQLWGHGR